MRYFILHQVRCITENLNNQSQNRTLQFWWSKIIQPSQDVIFHQHFFSEYLEILELWSNLEQSHISRPCMRWFLCVWQSSNLHHFLLWMQKNPKGKLFPFLTYWALSKVSSTFSNNCTKLYFIPLFIVSYSRYEIFMLLAPFSCHWIYKAHPFSVKAEQLKAVIYSFFYLLC